MRKGLWTSVLTLLAGAGLAHAENPGLALGIATMPEPEAAPAVAPASAAVPTYAEPPAGGESYPAGDVDSGWGHHAAERFGHGPGDVGGGRIYGGAEYLLWWVKGYSTPPLVTTGTSASLGAGGTLGTETLFPTQRLANDDPYSGGRFVLGAWLDDCHSLGVEGSYFFLGQRSENFFAGSAAFPLLARPFFNASTGMSDVELTARPGVALAGGGTTGPLSTGSVAVSSQTRLWGGEANLRTNLSHGSRGNLDLIGGFRYLDLEESLTIDESTMSSPDLASLGPAFAPLAGLGFNISDRFATRNQFYGGQVGAAGEFFVGNRLSLCAVAKVALGSTHEVVEINGGTVETAADGTVTRSAGGLLAQQSNIGRFSHDAFAVVPEATVSVGYYVTPGVRVSVGYDFLYWSRVVRPGDQIDTVIDASQVPSFLNSFPPASAARPLPLLRQTDFWAQGVNVGVEFRY